MSDVHILITVSFPEALVEQLQAVSPRLIIHFHPVGSVEDLPEELLPNIDVLYTVNVLPDPEDAPDLRWIQFHYAGIDHIVDQLIMREDLLVTTLSGAAVPQTAEFALGSILALGHRVPQMMHDSPEERWDEKRYQRYRPAELRGSTVGIVGYGSIGREVARLCHAFGANVLATKYNLKHLEDDGYTLKGLGDPHAIIPDRLYPPQAIRSMVSACDFIVITVPMTPETRGLVGESVFSKMKPTACLVDISRGGVVDHGALVAALKDDRLAGAALDVYPVEPLPASSPLWGMSNVILSPHVAGASGSYLARAADLFAENLQRFLDGRQLLNLYDPNRGY